MTSELQRQDASWPAPQDAESARAFCLRLTETLEELMATLDEEATLIRGAKLREAATLGPRKAILAEDYRRALDTLRDSAAVLGQNAPDEVDDLKKRHKQFERILQSNLAVLATARTVSEALVKSVAEAVGTRGAKPSTYGANARRPEDAPRSGAIAVDVAL